MFKKLYPTAYYKRIYDIPLDVLKQKKIKALVFDVDNTLAPYDDAEPDENTIAFMTRAQTEGFSICLLSNNTSHRVTLYNEKLGLPMIARACKPLVRGLKKAMTLMETDKSNTVMIGDQIFTDIWCGNRVGVHTILVEPCSVRDEWSARLKRGIEKVVINEYLKEKKKGSRVIK